MQLFYCDVGEALPIGFQADDATVNFSGSTATATLRATPSGPVLYTLNGILDAPVGGRIATGYIPLTNTETGTAGTFYGEITVVKAGQAWSPLIIPFKVVVGAEFPGSTDIDVAQMAVGNLGQTEVVSSLQAPTTKAERLLALFYGTVLKGLLARHDWRWAKKRVALTDVTTEQGERLGWAYVYALPADCVKPVAIELGLRNSAPPPRFAIESNNEGDGRVLLCDVPEAVLVYTSLVTDPSVWDPAFLDAFTWALAARIAMPLTGKADLASGAMTFAGPLLSQAITLDANEPNAEPSTNAVSELITVRSW